MWLVERQRSGGVQRASHCGSSDQELGSIRPSTRHHAALASWSLFFARPSLRLSSEVRPLASPTQREDSACCVPLRSDDRKDPLLNSRHYWASRIPYSAGRIHGDHV